MISPDKKFGPQIAQLMLAFCKDIYKESKASGIRVNTEFIFRNGKGDLTMKSFITPDGQTERMMDTEALAPRGTKLSHDAFKKLKVMARRKKR